MMPLLQECRAGFYDAESLHIHAYDSLHGSHTPCLSGDIEFYREFAKSIDGPILELGSGTGRVSHALAACGFDVTGLEYSQDFLAIAHHKSTTRSRNKGRLRFIQGDMRHFELSERYPLILAPFRTFHALLTPNDQMDALRSIHSHLRHDGRLILHLFDPPIDDLSSLKKPAPDNRTGMDYWTGETISASLEGLEIDPFNQILKNHWIYRRHETEDNLELVQNLTLTVRWTYRQEMKHLLTLAGFKAMEEYGNFQSAPPSHGSEQILICAPL